MRAPSLFALAICLGAIGATSPAFAATPPDPCDKDIFDDMATNATEGFTNMDGVIAGLMKPPQPASSSNCLNNIFSVWDLDPKSMAVELLGSAFGPGMLGYTMSGVTLSGSNPLVRPVMAAVDNIFDSFLNLNVCGELWSGIGEAMKPISYAVDGAGKLQMVLSSAKSADFGSIPFTFGGYTGKVEFK